MSEQQRKRAARKAITGNVVALNQVLSLSEADFLAVVNACVEREIVNDGQQRAFLDTLCGKTLQARVQDFLTQITSVVGMLPDYLDDFVLILFNADTLLTQSAAKEVAKKYGYNLPKYESASGSVADSVGPAPKLLKYEPAGGSAPAVVSDSAVGPSPIDTTNAGSAQSSSSQLSEQGKDSEEVTSDAWGFGSKKEKKNDEEKAADDIVYKYKVNETGERGVVLIINNVYFKEKDKADRTSSNEDAKRLEELFKGLRYQVIVQEDLEAAEIRKKVSAIAAGVVTKKHDSFICCILSHGNPKGIEGVDGETVTVPELANIVNSKECSALHGKPKIFFFQACRGTEVPEPSTADSSVPWPPKEEEMVADGIARALPPEADFLFGFSTSDGNVAARGVYTGSQYIKALCEFISKHSSKLSLYELLLLVNYKVSENPIDYKMSYKYHQMPEIRSTLRGKFYFKK
ncbi:PREDICTED: caspase-3-like [Amphimedon queenslandica]|uniref:Uncharacterized protein n=1 Tax=Amphimedon queenslandica TaxID=400682 RepID=A0A1X7T8E3_AMPQE|nr:PREDICTED: caspase-3-like [Amphimedon queenslandica]|eukprot:XP_011408075.1 PREDICTED: caspase-3-like [Amphimedon queenslandica]